MKYIFTYVCLIYNHKNIPFFIINLIDTPPPSPHSAEAVPLLGVPGGSLFTVALRGVLASLGWSWVGDCSLS